MNATAAPAPPASWAAPVADKPVIATVPIPGSKSLTNRYLVLAALASSPSQIHEPLISRDTTLMAAALRSLGVRIEETREAAAAPTTWLVHPEPLQGPADIDCGLAGTVMRFLPPVAALATGDIRLDGDARARQRPMAAILDALRQLGISVTDDAGHLPVTITGTGSVRGGEVSVDASASSQFVSALLLAAPRFDAGLTVHHVGPPMPSAPHVTMTVEAMRDVAVVVEDEHPNTWHVEPGPIGALDVRVEPDLSNAAPFVAAAAVTGGTVRIPGWPQHTTQAGDQLRDLLDAMGVDIAVDRDGLTAHGTGELYGVDADLSEAGELAPTVAALAALASTPSRLRGIAHIRGHETDRLAALATELTTLGGSVQETEDGLHIDPKPLHGGMFHSYADHRMATVGAILGLVVSGIEVDDIATTAKTMPEFPQLWQAMVDGALVPAGVDLPAAGA